MSTTITIKREELTDYLDAYGKAATLHLSEGESAEDVRRFKYAAGRNYNRFLSLAKATEKKQVEMQESYSDPELDKFHELRIQLCEDFAETDVDGKPKFREYDDGRPREYQIEASLKDDFREAVDELKSTYKDALDRDKANDEATNAVLKEEVEVKIYTIDWDKVPVAIAGGYIDAISAMIVGLPDLDAE